MYYPIMNVCYHCVYSCICMVNTINDLYGNIYIFLFVGFYVGGLGASDWRLEIGYLKI